VLGAEGSERIRDSHAAAALSGMVLAVGRCGEYGRIVEKPGVNGCVAHFVTQFSAKWKSKIGNIWLERLIPPGSFCKSGF
jgi:hypothetical protein